MYSDLYPMIHKRKSFHIFRGTEKLSWDELEAIKEKITTLVPLSPSIKTEIRLAGALPGSRNGEEYTILFYSEKAVDYLQNIGYLGEQLDLYLASVNIGALWCGMSKPKSLVTEDGLEFVIMMKIAKLPQSRFKRGLFAAGRKKTDEIWSGEYLSDIGEDARLAPSSMNSQPWLVEAGEGKLTVYRIQPKGSAAKRDRTFFYNSVDMGIFFLFLETALSHAGYSYKRNLCYDGGEDEKTKSAEYSIR